MEKVLAKREISYAEKVGSVSWVLSEHKTDINRMLRNISSIKVIKSLIIDLIKDEAVLDGTTAYSYIDTITRFYNKANLEKYINNVINAGKSYPTMDIPYRHKSRNQLI